MSKGLGATERFVLDHLAAKKRGRGSHPEDYWRVRNIAKAWGQTSDPTAAQIETVRRAVRSLTRKGLIESDRFLCERVEVSHYYWRCWSSDCHKGDIAVWSDPDSEPLADPSDEPRCPNAERVAYTRRVSRHELYARLPIEPDEIAGVNDRERARKARFRRLVEEARGLT
jgi:hypothetical protein